MTRRFYSKPVYQTLSPVAGRRHHCVFTDAQGVERAKALWAAMPANSDCILVHPAPGGERLVGATQVTPDALQAYLAARLPELLLGTQFYLLGREQFVWPLHALLCAAHVSPAQCAVERCGPPSRDVYCIHCRHTTADVDHTPITCAGCGRPLHVYDHFSRRLGRYMGFQVNAECETEIPQPEALLS